MLPQNEVRDGGRRTKNLSLLAPRSMLLVLQTVIGDAFVSAEFNWQDKSRWHGRFLRTSA